jgi:HEAT repeat protein
MPLFGQPDVQKMKAKLVVNALIKALSTKNSAPIRKEAAEGLGEIGDAPASVNSLK